MDMLNTIERQQEIVRLTQQQGKVAVKQLAQHFAVSEVTIRSDLAVLDQKKLLVRSRGGALINSELSRELSLKEKRHCYSALKQQLGQAVAALIHDGDRVILDSGTTTQQVAANAEESASASEELASQSEALRAMLPSARRRNEVLRWDDPRPALRETIDWFRRR